MMKSRVVILVVGVLAVVGCSSMSYQYVDAGTAAELQQSRSKSMSPMIEKELDDWTPDHTNLIAAIEPIHAPDLVVVGSWTTPMFLEGSTLDIARHEHGLSVKFSTGGCLADWELSRTAIRTNGLIRLNRPVQEYRPFTYDTLYPARVAGRDYLISQSGIRFLLEHYATNGVVRWAEHIEHAAFHRDSKEDTQQ